MANYNSSLSSTQIETILTGINSTTGTIQRNADGTFQAASLYPLLVSATAPTTSTVGAVTQMLKYGSLLYVCTAVSGATYTWEQVGGSGSGGGVSLTTAVATLTVAGWSNNAQTVAVSGVTESNTVMISPAPASCLAFDNSKVIVTAQGTGTLTFSCTTVPSAAITIYAAIFS